MVRSFLARRQTECTQNTKIQNIIIINIIITIIVRNNIERGTLTQNTMHVPRCTQMITTTLKANKNNHKLLQTIYDHFHVYLGHQWDNCCGGILQTLLMLNQPH